MGYLISYRDEMGLVRELEANNEADVVDLLFRLHLRSLTTLSIWPPLEPTAFHFDLTAGR
jgi:hypothetical protein